MNGFELDRGQPGQGSLSAAAVVGAFDPGDDRDPELVAGGPGPSVEDVVLQQAEERFHGCVVAGGTDATHRADHLVAVEGGDEFSAAELGSAVGVRHAAGQVTASGG